MIFLFIDYENWMMVDLVFVRFGVLVIVNNCIVIMFRWLIVWIVLLVLIDVGWIALVL